MTTNAPERQVQVLIVGGGLAGPLLACLLAPLGLRVCLVERRPDPRRAGYAGGRSINLALSTRGITALREAGLADRVLEGAIPMRGRALHLPTGEVAFQPYSAIPTDAINSVSRGGLSVELLRAAGDTPGVELLFDHACTDVNFDESSAAFAGPAGSTLRIRAEAIIGCDGAFSAVRAAMQRLDRFDYSQSYLGHGYKELRIPPSPGGDYAMRPDALHIWPRASSMMIALPNPDRSFTCTLFWPFEGAHSFAEVPPGPRVRPFFERHYPDAVSLMPDLAADFARNPVSSLVTIRCYPWARGSVGLVGDAAHAIVPFYGQGMNAAFEDCVLLARHASEHFAAGRADWLTALDQYQRARKPDAEAIADMALDNFVEMRDTVASPEFQYRKRIEQALHESFPDRVVPQYNLGRRPRRSHRLAPHRRRGAGHARRRLAPPRARPGARCDRRARHGARDMMYDITPPMRTTTAAWPGDTPMTREVLLDQARGDSVTLSTVRLTTHLGAHADAPSHYGLGADGIGERRLEYYLGPCRLVDARVARAARVRPGDIVGDLADLDAPRLLIRTRTRPDPQTWNPDFAALSPELVDVLAARGVITIGVDTPSVDLFESKDLPAHKAFLRHDMAILEGLDLDAVPTGRYELIALPLRLDGMDASPVRALLRSP
jgi:kynurenine 3-monooxygenase